MDSACADCAKVFPRSEMYLVVPPRARGMSFWLCIPCWDNLVGAAIMQALR